MFGSPTRRQRRPLWAWSAVLLLAAVVGCLLMSGRARSVAIAEASTAARLTAQTELAALLERRDLIAPVVGDRAEELRSAIESQITSAGPIDDVRIYSSLGRILYAGDPAIVGTRPSYLRDAAFEVASGEPRTQVRNSLVQTLAPISLSPGGTVVVAEMSQPAGPVATAAATPWYIGAALCGALFLGTIALVVASSRSQTPSPVPVQVFPAAEPMPPNYNRREPGAAPADPWRVAAERSRRSAEARADAAEQNVREIKKRLAEALVAKRALEARLVASEGATHKSDSKAAALRARLGETTERLNRAEIDANALRERLALRQQELDESLSRLPSARVNADRVDELERRLEASEARGEALRARLETARSRADEMASEMARMERDLEFTAGQFHMSKLSEALRDIEQEAKRDDANEQFERPLIIQGNGGSGAKVR